MKQVSLEDVGFLLRFIEVTLEDMRVTEECNVGWPAFVQQAKSRIDGAFLLWDVTKRRTQGDISEILSRLKSLHSRTALEFQVVLSSSTSELLHYLAIDAETIFLIRISFQGCDSDNVGFH